MNIAAPFALVWILCFSTGADLADTSLTAQASLPEKPMAELILPAGTEVVLATTGVITSKTHVKGDFVEMVTTADIVIDGKIVVPVGSPARAQVVSAQIRGAFGQSGRLIIEPLYIKVGDKVIRLTGTLAEKGSITPGGFVGMFALTPIISGRSAEIPPGTSIIAKVFRDVRLSVSAP